MFIKSVIIASMVASVAAFAPRANIRTIVRMNAEEEINTELTESEMIPEVPVASFDPKSAVGAGVAPIQFFDPMGMSKEVDEPTFKLWQEAETKHARVAMLAFVGLITGELISGSTPLFNGAITGPAIFQFQQADAAMPAFWVGVLTICAWIEGNTIINNWQPWDETAKDPLGRAKLAESTTPGDLKFDPMGLKPKDETAYKTMKTKELNNGRLAMIGVAGMVGQELATGSSIF